MQIKLKLTVAAAIAAAWGLAGAQDVQVVKIGHVAPMSGQQASYGKDNDNGVRMAIEDLNTQNITIGGKKVRFEIQTEDDAVGAGLAFYAADGLKLKKVAIIDDRTAYGQGVAEVFKKTAQSKGMQIVDEQFTNDKATDFMAILTAVKSKNPDAIFYGGMHPQAAPMLRQMEQLGM